MSSTHCPGGQGAQRGPRPRLPAPCPQVTEPGGCQPRDTVPPGPLPRSRSAAIGLALLRQGVRLEPAGAHCAPHPVGSATCTNSPSCPGCPRLRCGPQERGCGQDSHPHPSQRRWPVPALALERHSAMPAPSCLNQCFADSVIIPCCSKAVFCWVQFS